MEPLGEVEPAPTRPDPLVKIGYPAALSLAANVSLYLVDRGGVPWPYLERNDVAVAQVADEPIPTP